MVRAPFIVDMFADGLKCAPLASTTVSVPFPFEEKTSRRAGSYAAASGPSPMAAVPIALPRARVTHREHVVVAHGEQALSRHIVG